MHGELEAARLIGEFHRDPHAVGAEHEPADGDGFAIHHAGDRAHAVGQRPEQRGDVGRGRWTEFDAGRRVVTRRRAMILGWNFLNPEHERLYRRARVLLDSEHERQRSEAERLSAEWSRYPEELRREKQAWLAHHFAERRRPYEKLVTDILSLCASPIMVLPGKPT